MVLFNHIILKNVDDKKKQRKTPHTASVKERPIMFNINSTVLLLCDYYTEQRIWVKATAGALHLAAGVQTFCQ